MENTMTPDASEKPKEKVTMRTIADEAGVTLTTVSRILNDKGDKYAEDTRNNILAIADRLKYRPNALVRGMQTGKTGTAGVMLPSSNPFYSKIIAGIHEVFIENDTIMLLSWNNRSLNKREEVLERQIIHQMVDRSVEGIILRPSSEEFERSYFEEIWERDIPLILVDREISTVATHFVGSNGLEAGKTAAEYLISLGHRNMLFVGAGTTTSTSRKREEGFRTVLSESPNACCLPTIDVDRDDAKHALHARLIGENRPTAIFCYNDQTARWVEDSIGDAGLSIPRDISLLGFGNEASTDYHLPLSTFDQHPEQLGVAAAQLYLDCIRDAKPQNIQRKVVPAELVIRESTGPVH